MWPCRQFCGVFCYPLLSAFSLYITRPSFHLVVKSLVLHMQLEESVFNTSFSLHCLLMPSSHLWITSIKSISSVYSLHPPSSVSGCFLQLLYIQVRKAWISYPLSAHNGRESSCLTCSWRSFFCFGFSLPATAHTSHEQQGVRPKEGGIPLGRNYWTHSGNKAGPITTGGKGAMGVVKKFQNASKTHIH